MGYEGPFLCAQHSLRARLWNLKWASRLQALKSPYGSSRRLSQLEGQTICSSEINIERAVHDV